MLITSPINLQAEVILKVEHKKKTKEEGTSPENRRIERSNFSKKRQ